MKWLLLPLLLVSCASARTERAALLLKMERGWCSGTAVARDVILSATHCWEMGGRLLEVNGRPAHALEKIDDGKDHSLVRVSVPLRSWTARIRPAKRGDDVTWLGNPNGVQNVLRRGYVARIDDDGTLLVEAPAFGGDSGSGVFNDRGELVGVLSGARWWKSGEIVFALVYCNPLAFTEREWVEIRS